MAKKHLQQMSKDEKGFVHGYIRANARAASGTGHWTDRATERQFTMEDATSALLRGLAIEVHNDKAPSIRALVRDQRGTCVVVELGSMRIITVYYNDPEDKHDTLDWTPYTWQVNLVDVVEQILSGERGDNEN